MRLCGCAQWCELLDALRVQPPAEVGAKQVVVPVARLAVQQQRRRPALLLQLGAQGVGVQRQVNGIARLGMGQRKIQQLARGQAHAGAPQRNARRGVLAQMRPKVAAGIAAGCGHARCGRVHSELGKAGWRGALSS
ncbi:MAG: hypothetical protein ACI83N_002393 [Hydrogenophaga sp.]